jgi:hypothetical protein
MRCWTLSERKGSEHKRLNIKGEEGHGARESGHKTEEAIQEAGQRAGESEQRAGDAGLLYEQKG